MAEAMQRLNTVVRQHKLSKAIQSLTFEIIKKKYLPSSTKQEGYTILLPGMADNASLGIRAVG
jgi:hypothetical protein